MPKANSWSWRRVLISSSSFGVFLFACAAARVQVHLRLFRSCVAGDGGSAQSDIPPFRGDCVRQDPSRQRLRIRAVHGPPQCRGSHASYEWAGAAALPHAPPPLVPSGSTPSHCAAVVQVLQGSLFVRCRLNFCCGERRWWGQPRFGSAGADPRPIAIPHRWGSWQRLPLFRRWGMARMGTRLPMATPPPPMPQHPTAPPPTILTQVPLLSNS